jgi:hypothetical protein
MNNESIIGKKGGSSGCGLLHDTKAENIWLQRVEQYVCAANFRAEV